MILRLCNNCGKEVEDSERFCAFCGSMMPITEDKSYLKAIDAASEDDVCALHDEEKSMLKARLDAVRGLTLKTKLTLIGIAAMILALYLLLPQAAVNKFGNSFDNLVNGGYASRQGNWIYSSYNGDLYRYNVKSEELERIGVGLFQNINVAGSYIYYSSYNTEIYRVKTNGKDPVKIISSDVGYASFIVIDNYIYATDLAGKLIRIKVDGSEACVVSNNWEFVMYEEDNKLYAVSYDVPKSHNNSSPKTAINLKIYSIDKYLLKEELVFEEAAASLPIHMENNFIYYLDEDKLNLVKYDLSNKSKDVVIDDKISNFNINSDFIYYQKEDDSIYKTNLDGTGAVKISTEGKKSILLLDDYIYYCDYEKLYRMKDDGSDIKYIGRPFSYNRNLQ